MSYSPLRIPGRRVALATLLALATFVASAQTQLGPSRFKHHAKAGRRLQLGGPPRPGATPSVLPQAQSWRLVGKPATSRAVLENPNSPVLSFVPDVPGTYVAEGVPMASGPALRLELAVGPGRTLAPVHTLANSNGDIVVDGATYPGPGSQGLNAVILDRDTLQKVDSFSGTVAAVVGFLDEYLNKNGTDVVYLLCTGSGGTGGDNSLLGPRLTQLGALGNLGLLSATLPFSFIGSQGLKAGQAYQVGGVNGAAADLRGSFAPDASANYAFTQLDYVPFTITPSADLVNPSTIQVGDQRAVTSNVPPGLAYNSYAGGFVLAVFASDTLAPVFSQTYATLANTPDVSIAQQQALTAMLAAYQGQPNFLVFLTTFGQAGVGYFPATFNFGRLAQQIARMGGTYEAVYSMNANDTYSLAGWADSRTNISKGREAGSLIPSSKGSGVLRGVLGRARQGNWYRPVTASPGPASNLGLYSVLGRPTQAWPHPAPGSAAEQVAYASISGQLVAGSSDVRLEYANTNRLLDPDSAQSTLAGLKDGTTDCGAVNPSTGTVTNPADTPFCHVRNQLYQEMSYLRTIRAFNTNLETVSLAAQANLALQLPVAQKNINDTLKLPPPSPVAGIVENLIGDVLTIGWAVGGEVAGPVFGLLSAALGFGTLLANEATGNSTVTDVNTTAANVATQAVNSFNQQTTARGVMFDAIYEDWGRFGALGAALANSTDPNWYWNGDVMTGQAQTALTNAANVSLYKSMLPVVYNLRVWNAQDPRALHPGDYKYQDFGSTSIFRNWRDWNYLGSPSGRVSNAALQYDFIMLTRIGPIDGAGGSNTFDPSYIQLTPDLFVQNIFKAPPDGLGVWKAEFYRQWPFQRAYCSAPGGSYAKDPDNPYLQVSNCDFEAPQLPQ